jgi:hypothetical protein
MWWGVRQSAVLSVNIGFKAMRAPHTRRAITKALQVMNRAMAFVHDTFIKASDLKLTVHIAREHPVAKGHRLAPAFQNLKTKVRHRTAIQMEAMTVEAPRASRVIQEWSRLIQFWLIYSPMQDHYPNSSSLFTARRSPILVPLSSQP